MKAIMSDALRKILSNKETAKELRTALNSLCDSGHEEVVTTIGGRIYTVTFCVLVQA